MSYHGNPPRRPSPAMGQLEGEPSATLQKAIACDELVAERDRFKRALLEIHGTYVECAIGRLVLMDTVKQMHSIAFRALNPASPVHSFPKVSP